MDHLYFTVIVVVTILAMVVIAVVAICKDHKFKGEIKAGTDEYGFTVSSQKEKLSSDERLSEKNSESLFNNE